MTRTLLKTCTSVEEAVESINSLTASFSKAHQRKPLVDLLASTTYSANDAKVQSAVHEVTLMVTDKVAKEAEAVKLAAEVKWFKERAGT